MTTSFNRFDLNLLRVFDAVMEERSVLRAGRRICLSQSAVSHALARLRDMLGDELFVRTARGMQPTARALAMAPLVHEAWKLLDAAIGPPNFEPSRSARRFTIAVSDFLTIVMIPHLLELLREEAPFVDIAIRSDSRLDLTEQINLGQIDAAIGTFSETPARFRSSALFEYDDVLIANSSRKLGNLSLEQLSGFPIAFISLHSERDGIVDGFVFERGLARRSEMFDRGALERAFSGSRQSPRLAVSLPNFLALPMLLQDAHLTAIVPRPLAMALTGLHPISMHELPYKTAPVGVSVLWHERNADDVPQTWLRRMLRRATEPLHSCVMEFERSSRSTSFPPPLRPAERV
jgi:DNA-binding transcriptional LysR family regulator